MFSALRFLRSQSKPATTVCRLPSPFWSRTRMSTRRAFGATPRNVLPFAAMMPARCVPWPAGSSPMPFVPAKFARAMTLPAGRSGCAAMPLSMSATTTPAPVESAPRRRGGDRVDAQAVLLRGAADLIEVPAVVRAATDGGDARVRCRAEHGPIGGDARECRVAEPSGHDVDVLECGDLGRAGAGEVSGDGPCGAGRDLDEGDLAGVEGGIDIDARDGGATGPCGPDEQRDNEQRRDQSSSASLDPHVCSCGT